MGWEIRVAWYGFPYLPKELAASLQGEGRRSPKALCIATYHLLFTALYRGEETKRSKQGGAARREVTPGERPLWYALTTYWVSHKSDVGSHSPELGGTNEQPRLFWKNLWWWYRSQVLKIIYHWLLIEWGGRPWIWSWLDQYMPIIHIGAIKLAALVFSFIASLWPSPI